MDNPNNKDPIDRPIKDITLSMMKVAENARKNGKGQLARDLEKLCVVATIGQSYIEQRDKSTILEVPMSDDRVRDIVAGEDK